MKSSAVVASFVDPFGFENHVVGLLMLRGRRRLEEDEGEGSHCMMAELNKRQSKRDCLIGTSETRGPRRS